MSAPPASAALRTGRLTLRTIAPGDAPAIVRIRGDLCAARMAGNVPHPYPIEVAHGWIALAMARHAFGRGFSFAIEAQDEGVVGDVALFKRPPGTDWEVGYAVDPARRRRGYARAALIASLDWAHRALGATRVTAGVFEDNAASLALLESCGFAVSGTTVAVYSLARDAKVACRYLIRDLTPPQDEPR